MSNNSVYFFKCLPYSFKHLSQLSTACECLMKKKRRWRLIACCMARLLFINTFSTMSKLLTPSTHSWSRKTLLSLYWIDLSVNSITTNSFWPQKANNRMLFLHDTFNGNVSIYNVYNWCHCDVIKTKLTACIQHKIPYKAHLGFFTFWKLTEWWHFVTYLWDERHTYTFRFQWTYNKRWQTNNETESETNDVTLTSRKACARNVILLSTALTIFARMYLGQAFSATITNIGPIRNLTNSHMTQLNVMWLCSWHVSIKYANHTIHTGHISSRHIPPENSPYRHFSALFCRHGTYPPALSLSVGIANNMKQKRAEL